MPTLIETISNFFGMNKYGFEIHDTAADAEKAKLKSPIPPNDDDGSIIVNSNLTSGSGALSSFLDYGKIINNENELITKYREMALHPEVESAIDDIVNEMLVLDDEKPSISIELDELDDVPKSVQNTIRQEFERIMDLLKFKASGYNLCRYWYVDGRMFLNVLIDFEKPTDGIKELRYVDPRKIRYVKKYLRTRDERTEQLLHTEFEEYFIYNPQGLLVNNTAWKLAKDTVIYCHSNLIDKNGNVVLSNLHKALKPLNQLRMMEDSLVIYRLARAPERRVFAVDVEHVPPHKAQQYVDDIMKRHKNKVVYNPTTGEVDASKRFMTMTDDYYIPMRGGKGTAITTLPGGENLGKIEDIQYFQRRLNSALNVPESRQESGGQFNLGRASEITRDEVKFQKFISRQRNQFATMFDQLLRIQLILKGIMTQTEWDRIRDRIRYKYLHDNFFSELKEAEILQNRMAVLDAVEPHRQVYFTRRNIMEEVLRMNEEEIEERLAEIDEEKAAGVPPPMGGDMQFGLPQEPGMGDPNDPNALPPPEDPMDPNQQFAQGGQEFGQQAQADPNAPSNLKKKKGPLMASFQKKVTPDQVSLAEQFKSRPMININEQDFPRIGVII